MIGTATVKVRNIINELDPDIVRCDHCNNYCDRSTIYSATSYYGLTYICHECHMKKQILY